MKRVIKDRVRVYCANGHEMISGPSYREAKLVLAADEDGCGWISCNAKRAKVVKT